MKISYCQRLYCSSPDISFHTITLVCDLHVNPWSPGRSFMVQKMGITSLFPVFYGLKISGSSFYLMTRCQVLGSSPTENHLEDLREISQSVDIHLWLGVNLTTGLSQVLGSRPYVFSCELKNSNDRTSYPLWYRTPCILLLVTLGKLLYTNCLCWPSINWVPGCQMIGESHSGDMETLWCDG